MKIVTFIISVLIWFNLNANTYYVATSGNDANTGSISNPWKTIQKAANTVIAGDSVFVKAGTYNERIIIQNSGTDSNNIVFSNYQNDVVIIDGNNISWWDWDGLLNVTDKSYVTINGFQIKNSYYGGIWVENSKHIIISNNYTFNTVSCGIGVWGSSNILVEKNEVELACNNGEQECISVANSHHCEVLNNHIHDNGPGTNGGEGIDIKAGSHDILVKKNIVHDLNDRLGIYSDAWDKHTYNIDIIANIVYHCQSSGFAVASERGGLIENVNYLNNISYENKWAGMELGGWTNIAYSGPTPIRHIKYINNTCFHNGSIDNGWGHGIVISNSYAKDVLIRNNICSQNSAQIAIENIDSGLVIDHNLIYGINNTPNSIYGSDSIVGDPMFWDISSFDFHLHYGSPAIDNGTLRNAPTVDFDNFESNYNDSADIGAYWFNPTYNTALEHVSIRNDNFSLYPNPVFDKLNIKINKVGNYKYSILLFNSEGMLVIDIQEVEIDDQITINRKKLSAGVYYISIYKSGSVIFSDKVIFQ